MKNGTYDYHLKVLIKGDKIKEKKDRFNLRLFPFLYNIGDLNQYKDTTEKEKKYLQYLRANQITTVKEIAKFFQTTKQNVYPTIKNLKEKNLIFYKDTGKLSKQPITLTDIGRAEINEYIKNKNTETINVDPEKQ